MGGREGGKEGGMGGREGEGREGGRPCYGCSAVPLPRSMVMDQRDPNTVSGLLKLHLRENSLLSDESLGTLVPHLEAKDTVRGGGGGVRSGE